MRRKTALYLDFDNIFIGLTQSNLEVASLFSSQPRKLLSILAEPDESGNYRDFIVRRCYINSDAKLQNPITLGSSLNYNFKALRRYFVEAGFEIIECPNLTYGMKNAADMRMCMDIMDSLNGPTHLDEYFVASGDSDFTPLLQRIRASDRTVSILTASHTSPAYTSNAHFVLDKSTFERLRPPTPIVAVTDGEEVVPEVEIIAPEVTEIVPAVDSAATQVSDFIDEFLRTSAEPVAMNRLGNEVKARFGIIIEATEYFGLESFSEFVASLEIEGLSTTRDVIWLNGLHRGPSDLSHLEGFDPVLESVVLDHDLPHLHSHEWQALWSTMRAIGQNDDFRASTLTKVLREELKIKKIDIAKSEIDTVLLLAKLGGCAIVGRTLPPATSIAKAFVDQVERGARFSGTPLSEDQRDALVAWCFPAAE